MIWLTWRQFRAPLLSVAAVLLALVAALAFTWARVSDLAGSTGFTGCRAAACETAAQSFLAALSSETAGWLYYVAIGVVLALPVLLGIFWGAPLAARELETGTYRLIFTQSVSRHRWLLVKLLIGGGAAALCTGVVSLVLTGWAAVIDDAEGNRINPWIFMARGIVPIAFAALAFVVGVTAGLLLRRTVAAMAVTLLVVAALQVAVPLVLPRLLAQPVTTVAALDLNAPFGLSVDLSTKEAHVDIDADMPDAWILSRTVVTSSGAEFRGRADPACLPSEDMGGFSEACRTWLAAQNLRQKVTYVPGSRFWALQWREFGVLIAVTLGLSWFALWWIRRRLI